MRKFLLVFLFEISFFQQSFTQIIDNRLPDGELVLDENTKAFFSSTEVETEFFYITSRFSVIFDKTRKTLFVLNKENLIIQRKRIGWKAIDIATATFYLIGDKVGFGSYHEGKYCAIISLENDLCDINVQSSHFLEINPRINDFKKIILSDNSILQSTYLWANRKDSTNKTVKIFTKENTQELYKNITDDFNTLLIHQHPRIDIAYWKEKIYIFDADKLLLQIHSTDGRLLEKKQFAQKDFPNLNKLMIQFKIDIATDKLYLIIRSQNAHIFEIQGDNSLKNYQIPFQVSIGQILDGKAYFYYFSKNSRENFIYFTELKE